MAIASICCMRVYMVEICTHSAQENSVSAANRSGQFSSAIKVFVFVEPAMAN